MKREFTVGGQARVLVDEPDAAPLTQGQIVTIKKLGVRPGNGVGVQYAVVTPGDYQVRLMHLEPFTPVRPAVRLDAEEAAYFEEIVDLDPLLHAWSTMSFEEVAAELDLELPTAVADDEDNDEEFNAAARLAEALDKIPKDRRLRFKDADGDEIEMLYLDDVCEHHGYEAVFRIVINDEAAADISLMHHGPGVMQFMHRWVKHYIEQRKNTETPEADTA